MRLTARLFLLTAFFYLFGPVVSVVFSTLGEKGLIEGDLCLGKKEHLWRGTIARGDASIPAPNLVKENVISFSVDSISYDPVVGEGAVDTLEMTDSDEDGYEDDYQVAISSSSLEQSNESASVLKSLRKTLFKNLGGLFPQAYALSISLEDPTATVAEESTNICDQEGVTCCPITTSGSFTCFLPNATNDSTLYIYVTDGKNLSSGITEKPNPHLLYLANSPSDLAGTGDDIYALTNSMTVKIEPTEDWVQVTGNHLDDYLNWSVTGGRQFDFDATQNYFGVLNSDGVDLYQYDPSSEATTATSCKARQSDALSYTAIKYTGDGMLRYSIEYGSTTQTAKIFYALDDTDCDPDGTTNNWIQFIASGDKDASAQDLTHKKTLSFDVMEMTVDSKDYVVAIYEDGNGQTRVRSAKAQGGTAKRFGGETPISSSLTAFDFKDIQFYHSQSSSSDKAKVLLLDAANDMVWDLAVNTVTGSTSVDYTLDSSVNGVAVGNNPVSMVQSSDRKRVYVLNRDDETISVLTTVESDESTLRDKPAVMATVSLKDYTPGKEITFSPSTLHYQDGRLFVGAENIKAAVVIDPSTITETQPEEETEEEIPVRRRPGRSKGR